MNRLILLIGGTILASIDIVLVVLLWILLELKLVSYASIMWFFSGTTFILLVVLGGTGLGLISLWAILALITPAKEFEEDEKK